MHTAWRSAVEKPDVGIFEILRRSAWNTRVQVGRPPISTSFESAAAVTSVRRHQQSNSDKVILLFGAGHDGSVAYLKSNLWYGTAPSNI